MERLIALYRRLEPDVFDRLGGHYRRNERLWIIAAIALVGTVPYGIINVWTQGRMAGSLHTWLDDQVPFLKQWVFVYLVFEPLAILPAFVIRDLGLLRQVAKAYFLSYGVGYLVFLVYPVRMVRVIDPEGTTFSDWAIRLFHYVDAPNNCFPSLHVAIAFVAALGMWKADRRVGAVSLALAVLITFSTVAQKQHYVADALAGTVLGLGAWWVHLRSFEPERARGPIAFPRWVQSILPALFVLTLGVFFVLHKRGVNPPPSRWESAGNTRSFNPATRQD